MRELERDQSDTTSRTSRPLTGSVLIVGAGRVGGSIARAAKNAGLTTEVAGREADPAGHRTVLLCVPDGAIASACENLAPKLDDEASIGHVSGATTLAALASASKTGRGTFSLHPLQTVPGTDTDLTGAPCAVAGSDADSLAVATGLADRLGMRPFAVPDDRRAAYHAAASMASNFLIALEESAAGLLERSGIEAPREVLAPLVLRTAANWADEGAAALTGPIARGDEQTVAGHLGALRETAPELVPLYEALAERTREIAKASK